MAPQPGAGERVLGMVAAVSSARRVGAPGVPTASSSAAIAS
ncbi:hypothetical protein [Streptomyces scabiei]